MSRSQSQARHAALLVYGSTAVWMALIGVPLLGLVFYSVLTVQRFGVTLHPTFSSYLDLVKSGRGEVVLQTIRIAVTVTVIEVLVAFPFAFWVAKRLRSVPAKITLLTLTVV